MTNRNSKTHALVDANAWRPKKTGAKKANKVKARSASKARHDKLREALAKGNV